MDVSLQKLILARLHAYVPCLGNFVLDLDTELQNNGS